MSPQDTTLEEDYQEALQRAKYHILSDSVSRNLILSLNENKVRRLTAKNEKELRKLAQLGVITRYMDNTVSLSDIGKELVRIIRYINNNL